jgi:hypothetical protein
MSSVKILWVFITAFSSTIAMVLLFNKHVIFRFNKILCLSIFGFISFIGLALETLDSVGFSTLNHPFALFDFLALTFYIVTIEKRLYRSLFAVMIQLSVISIFNAIIVYIYNLFFPIYTFEQLDSFEKLLPEVFLKIIFFLLFFFFYSRSKWFYNLIFAIPLSLIFLPYQSASSIINNYIGRMDPVSIKGNNSLAIIGIIGLSIFFIVFISIFLYFINKKNLLTKLESKEELLSIQKDYITTLTNTFNSAAIFRHDLSNYISLLNTLNTSGNHKEYEQYQENLISSCDSLICNFNQPLSAYDKKEEPIKQSPVQKYLLSIFDTIDHSNLISAGLFIIHFYCGDIFYNRDNFFVLPSYILLLLTIIIFRVQKKATKNEVRVMIGIFIYSVSIFALQAKYDSFFIATISLFLFFLILLVRNHKKFNRIFRIILYTTFIFLLISYGIITIKYNNLIYTVIFLEIYSIIIVLSLLVQNKKIKKDISSDIFNSEGYRTLKKETIIFTNTFERIKAQINSVDISLDKNQILLNTYDSCFMQYKTGYSVLNAILSSKQQRCIENNIDFITNINISSQISLDEFNLGKLLFNLLDNAIEATNKVVNNTREIHLSINTKANLLYINVTNSKNNAESPIDNKMKSTKRESGHGLGLLIIQDIVNSYQGTIKMEDLGNTFISNIILEL